MSAELCNKQKTSHWFSLSLTSFLSSLNLMSNRLRKSEHGKIQKMLKNTSTLTKGSIRVRTQVFYWVFCILKNIPLLIFSYTKNFNKPLIRKAVLAIKQTLSHTQYFYLKWMKIRKFFFLFILIVQTWKTRNTRWTWK